MVLNVVFIFYRLKLNISIDSQTLDLKRSDGKDKQAILRAELRFELGLVS